MTAGDEKVEISMVGLEEDGIMPADVHSALEKAQKERRFRYLLTGTIGGAALLGSVVFSLAALYGTIIGIAVAIYLTNREHKRTTDAISARMPEARENASRKSSEE